MINSIIRHDLRLISHNSKTWYYFAGIYAMFGLIFSWLMRKFLEKQLILDSVNHGITEEVIHPFYAWFVLILLVLTPMLSTQALCAEHSSKTIINYYCAPISAGKVLLAKFLSRIMVLLALLLAISIMPLSIVQAGSLDWGQFTCSILGAFLLACTALAIGLGTASFVHSVTRANLLVFLALLALVLIEWAAQFSGQAAMFLQAFGLLSPVKYFLAGSLNLHSAAYYLFLITLFLILGSIGFKRGLSNV